MNAKSYTKQELALLYFPDSSPVVASAHLMRWITRNKPLLKELQNTGYTRYNKQLTPLQVSQIFYYLGEP